METTDQNASVEVGSRDATRVKEAGGSSADARSSEEPVAQACPAASMKKDESYKRVMLIAAGSAMAASCEPCLNMVVPNLIEAGASDSEIRRAVEIGQYINDREADIMKEAADVLAGTSFLNREVPEECTPDEMKPLRIDRTSMLIAVGAAVAGNCQSCLHTVVAELKRAGAGMEEIRGAVQVGLHVKERPAALIRETAEKLTGPL